MMSSPPRWYELYRNNDALLARSVATSIASMAFDVRLLDRRGIEIEPGTEITDDVEPPFAVLVLDADAATLVEVLPEIIAEQTDFDDLMLQYERTLGRRRRSLLIVLIAIVAVLSTLGLIRL